MDHQAWQSQPPESLWYILQARYFHLNHSYDLHQRIKGGLLKEANNCGAWSTEGPDHIARGGNKALNRTCIVTEANWSSQRKGMEPPAVVWVYLERRWTCTTVAICSRSRCSWGRISSQVIQIVHVKGWIWHSVSLWISLCEMLSSDGHKAYCNRSILNRRWALNMTISSMFYLPPWLVIYL